MFLRKIYFFTFGNFFSVSLSNLFGNKWLGLAEADTFGGFRYIHFFGLKKFNITIVLAFG